MADEEIIDLVELTVYDPAIPGTKTLRYATKGIYDDDGNYYEPRLKQAGNFELHLFEPGKTAGAAQIGHGEIILLNPQEALDQPGKLDGLFNYDFDGRTAVLKQFTAALGLVVLTSCTMEQPTGGSEISIQITDPQAVLNAPIQAVKYAGDNVLPNGINGTADIAGQPKPLAFGNVSRENDAQSGNITPICVNTSKLIYQGHSSAASIPAVYDMGVGLSKGTTDYISQADMEANAPAPGYYRVWSSSTYGTFFRLGATPAGQITCDIIEGATASARTAAQVAKRIINYALPSITVSATDVAALDTATSSMSHHGEVGIYIKVEMNIMAALDQVLGSVGACYGFDQDNIFRMQRLEAPAGAPDVTLTDCLDLNRVTSNDPGRGIPVKQVNLKYGKNYTVQTSGLGGIVPYLIDSSAWKWYAGTNVPNVISSLVFGNGIFIATRGLSNGYWYSTDGINWTWATLPSPADGTGSLSVVYGNGIFVGSYPSSTDKRNTFTSVDGINWTVHTNALSTNFSGGITGLAFGNGKFIVTCSGYSAVSTDGVTWSEGAMSSTETYWRVAAGNGVYIAVATFTDKSAWSANGTTWNAVVLPDTQAWKSPVYGNGLFVLGGGSSARVTIDNGASWTKYDFPSASMGIYDLVYANGVFVATQTFNGNCLMSANGATWSLSALASGQTLEGRIVVGNGSFIVIPLNAATNGINVLSVSTPTLRSIWLSKEFRTVTAGPDSSVTDVYLTAPELNVTTLLVYEDDAQAEATRLLNLYKVRRDVFEAPVHASVLPYLAPGKVLKLYDTRFGLSGGKLFREIGIIIDREQGKTTPIIWG